MITSLTLPFRFDVERLQIDLARVRFDEWRPHYNENDYGGQWRGVALRSLDGSSGKLYTPPNQSATAFADTEILQRCGYFREVLAAFGCPLKTVRLLGLAPASFVREHSDPDLRYEEGEMRIHVPIQTSDDVESGVEFYLDGERLDLEEGGCYYLNVSLPHRISNRSPKERVHLVIDLEVDEWAHEIVKRGVPVARLRRRNRGFESFYRSVLRDSSLAEKLRAAPDAASFQRFIVAMGQESGFDFVAEEIGSSADISEDDVDPRGWAPIAAYVRDGQPLANWAYLGRRRLTEPFFEDSVRLGLRSPFARSLRFEAPLRAQDGSREPSGFIFHMSRCGSTLVSRTFATLPRVLAVSEAPPVDTMIQSGRADWVRAVILALGRLGDGRESCYVVKFDAAHIHKLAVIREAFPKTPWIFLFRDPLEVLVSQLRSPGMHCLAGAIDPSILGMTFQDMISLNREEWSARVLAKILSSALSHRHDPAGLFVDYRDLPLAIWESIARHFGIVFNNDEVRQMQESALFHAKMPEQTFAPDSGSKQREASEMVRALAGEFLEPLYRQLMSL